MVLQPSTLQSSFIIHHSSLTNHSPQPQSMSQVLALACVFLVIASSATVTIPKLIGEMTVGILYGVAFIHNQVTLVYIHLPSHTNRTWHLVQHMQLQHSSNRPLNNSTVRGVYQALYSVHTHTHIPRIPSPICTRTHTKLLCHLQLISILMHTIPSHAPHPHAHNPLTHTHTPHPTTTPPGLVLFLVLVLSVGAVAGGIRAWLFESASVRVMCRLRQRVFASVCWQEIGFYDRVRIGELTNRLGEVCFCGGGGSGGVCVCVYALCMCMMCVYMMCVCVCIVWYSTPVNYSPCPLSFPIVSPLISYRVPSHFLSSPSHFLSCPLSFPFFPLSFPFVPLSFPFFPLSFPIVSPLIPGHTIDEKCRHHIHKHAVALHGSGTRWHGAHGGDLT